MTTHPSTTAQPKRLPPDGAPPPDSFDRPAGWRLEDADLTLEYESSDGEPMAENDYQLVVITETYQTLKIRFADDDGIYVGADMLIYYHRNDNVTRIAPDVFAVPNPLGKHNRMSWAVSLEGGRLPSFVLEVASPGTWRVDRDRKVRIYAEMGVEELWLFDPMRALFPGLPLEGYRLVGGEYHPIAIEPDTDGVLRGRSDALNLDLCVRSDDQLRFFDPTQSRWLLAPSESEEARIAALAQRDAALTRAAFSEAERQVERRARDAAEARAAEAEAELARLLRSLQTTEE